MASSARWLQVAVVLGVFAASMLLVAVRPRGRHEAWWTCGGAAVLLALGLVEPSAALRVASAGRDALLFLLGLLLLSALLERSGFFGWAALRCAALAEGDGRALYRNVFILGALLTVTLSLDTTAVMLTPVVLGFVQRLRIPARPYVFACAFVANVASLLLPMSNLTNLLLLDAMHLSFAAYARRMWVPQLLVLLAQFAAFRLLFRRELPARVDAAALPAPRSAIVEPRFFAAACAVLGAVCAGYFVAPRAGVPAHVVALAGAAALAAAGMVTARLGLGWLRDLPLGVFPLVLGLFVLVAALERLGLAGELGALALGVRPGGPREALTAAGAAALATGINNLPAALLAHGSLQDHPELLPYVLAGTNVGPCATAFGSLATLLVLAVARRHGVEVRRRDLLAVGALVTPALLAIAVGALLLGP